MQKFIYLESAYLIYGEFQPETEGWVYDRYIDLPLAASGFEELLKKERIDPSFSQTYSVTSKNGNKRQRIHPMEELLRLGNGEGSLEVGQSSNQAVANYGKTSGSERCNNPQC